MGKKPSDTAVSELVQSIGLMVRRVRFASASQDYSWSETSALSRLLKVGPMTTAELARAQGMRPQSMRTIVAALETGGLLARKPHPTDGRQVILELTAKGTEVQKKSSEAKRTWLAKAVGRLDRDEQETLFAAGAIMKRLVEKDPL